MCKVGQKAHPVWAATLLSKITKSLEYFSLLASQTPSSLCSLDDLYYALNIVDEVGNHSWNYYTL